MVREAGTSPLRTLVGSHRSRTESHGSARAAGALSTTRCHAVRVLVRKAVPGSERGFVPSLRLRKNTRWWQPDQEWEGGCFPTAIFVQQGKLTTPDTLLWPGRSRGSPIRRLAVTRPGESLNFLERPARTALDRSLSLLHGTLTYTHLTSGTEQFLTLFGDWASPPHDHRQHYVGRHRRRAINPVRCLYEILAIIPVNRNANPAPVTTPTRASFAPSPKIRNKTS